MASSGTVNQTISVFSLSLPNAIIRPPVCRARVFVRLSILRLVRTTRFSTAYPAADSVMASALPRLPTPTMLMDGRRWEDLFGATAGRIADGRELRDGMLPLYWFHGKREASFPAVQVRPNTAQPQGVVVQGRLQGQGI